MDTETIQRRWRHVTWGTKRSWLPGDERGYAHAKQFKWMRRELRKLRTWVGRLIGHAKHDRRMNRCYLKGLEGDAMNVILAAAGANLRKLLRLLPCAQPIRLLADLLSRFARYHHTALLPKVA